MENKEKVAFLKALVKVQGLIEPAKKDSKNPHFGSKYASLGSVNEAVMGPLNEAGFAVLSGGHIGSNGKNYLRTTLFHVDGHSESFDYPLIESAANPQHIASSLTYARRYSLCALLNLSVEDDDGNGSVPKAQTPAEKVFKPEPRGQERPPVPMGDVITEGQGKRLYAIWKGAKKSDEEVKAYIKAKYGYNSTREIRKSEYEAICEWCEKVEEEVAF